MAAPFSRVNATAFEQILSNDFNRSQNVNSRDRQNVLKGASRSVPAIAAGSGELIGAVIDSVDQMVELYPGTGFNMNLNANEAYVTYPVAVTADDSEYQVLRWQTQEVVFAAPHASLPRIDLVIVTPVAEFTDTQLRNVLVDPANRTVAANLVPKTYNPSGTVTVLMGAPAAEPVPPTYTLGQFPIAEVQVPPGVATSADFTVTPRMWRHAVSVGASAHGIISGFDLAWSTGTWDESTEDSRPNVNQGFNVVAINGEILTSTAVAAFNVEIDTANDPFAVAADADNDEPYYIYAVGGHELPYGHSTIGAPATPCPYALVYSTVAPNKYGMPATAISTKRGSTQRAAVYIGMGFKIHGTTQSKPCRIAGDMIYALTGNVSWGAGGQFVGFYDFNATVGLSPTSTGMVWASRPPTSYLGRFRARLHDTVAARTVWLDNGAEGFAIAELQMAVANRAVSHEFDVPFSQSSPSTSVRMKTDIPTTISTNFAMCPIAWEMRVPRLGKQSPTT